jgi:hypothetical protein
LLDIPFERGFYSPNPWVSDGRRPEGSEEKREAGREGEIENVPG